jgi:hypothetical protein
MQPNNFYHPSVLWREDLLFSHGGQIRKYDFKTAQWKALPISDGSDYALFVVNDRLYAANPATVIEITEDGTATRLLASARRQPPASALDGQPTGRSMLFEGPGHSLRITTRNKIYTWAGADWHEDPAELPNPFQAELYMGGVLIRDGASSSLCLLTTESAAPEVCIANNARPGNANPANPSQRGGGYVSGAPSTSIRPPSAQAWVPSTQPLWEMPPGSNFATLPAAMGQSNLYLYVDHSEIQQIVDKDHLIVGEKVIAKDGYHAVLLCFTRGLPSPQKVFLKFDAVAGPPPAKPMWMLCSPKFLFFGHDSIGGKPGVWRVPLSQLEPAVAAR